MNKFLLLVGALQVASVCGSVIPPPKNYQYKAGDRYAYIADDNQQVHLVDMWEAPVAMDTQPVFYHLFTRQNPTSSQILTQGKAGSVQNSNFNPDRDTKFIIHGWMSNADTIHNPRIRDAFLAVVDVNIIVVDWSSVARGGYISAATGTPGVGIQIAQFINFLGSSVGNNVNKIHLVGFSLGAHAAGVAGRNVGGNVRRITGLDPAGPLWTSSSQRLRATDGNYVEAIHTNGGITGVGSRVAYADFYPNGGTNQPGCISGVIGSGCSHSRAWEFFVETLAHDLFVGNLCGSESDARNNNGCSGAAGVMGTVNVNKFLSGPYHLRTNSASPFALTLRTETLVIF